MTVRAGDGMRGFSDRDLPLAAGVLTGIRLWHVDLAAFDAVLHDAPAATDGLLTGVFGATWLRGENIAVCGGGRQPAVGHPDLVPAARCGCGFWAYWLPRDALRSDYQGAEVIGIMQGYGRTRIGTRGCRCSKARILALHVHSVAPDLQVRDLQPHDVSVMLGRYYGVPSYASLEEMLAAHPPTADYLPRRQQRAVGLPPRSATPTRVSWPRVAALAAAYLVLASVLITLAAAWWGARAAAAVTVVTLVGGVWPVGTWWLPRWARKLPDVGGRQEDIAGVPTASVAAQSAPATGDIRGGAPAGSTRRPGGYRRRVRQKPPAPPGPSPRHGDRGSTRRQASSRRPGLPVPPQ